MASAGFLPVNRVTLWPNRWTAAPQACRFNSILVSEQAFSKGAVMSFHDHLVPVNLRAPSTNVCFVFFHFLVDSAHECSARVDLKQLWPIQKLAIVNVLKRARDFNSLSRSRVRPLWNSWQHRPLSKRFCMFFASYHAPECHVVKKDLLGNCIWRGHIEIGARNVFWSEEIYLPNCLLD